MSAVNLKTNIRLFLRIFSFFGLIQVRYGREDQLEVVKSSAFIIPILLFIYWINAVVVFCFERPTTDNISLVSNIIQLTLNSIMISVAMIIPIKDMQLARRIIKQIDELNSELEKVGVLINFRKTRRDFAGIFGFFFLFLVYSVTYDGYSTFKNGMMSIKYWFVTILPSVYMVLVLTQAICVLSLVRKIYRNVNRAIAVQLPSEEDENQDEDFNRIQSGGKVGVVLAPEMVSTFFPKVFQILGSLSEICQKLETYYGPLFLATFTTIFVVTSIQLYYCYQIIIQAQDEARGYSIWSLIMCMNVVIINVVLVLCITAFCQTITNQSKRSAHYMYKLQTLGSKSMSAKEIQTLVQGTQFLPKTVTFSALNFFTLDYSMLCGMVGAITTYLIIFIQFSNVYLVKNTDSLSIRSGARPH